MTCWRRLRDWHPAGTWQRLWQRVLDEPGLADAIDWSRALIGSSSVRAVFGGRKPVRIPRIARKTAANDMSSRTPGARRWPWRTPGRIDTTV